MSGEEQSPDVLQTAPSPHSPHPLNAPQPTSESVLELKEPLVQRVQGMGEETMHGDTCTDACVRTREHKCVCASVFVCARVCVLPEDLGGTHFRPQGTAPPRAACTHTRTHRACCLLPRSQTTTATCTGSCTRYWHRVAPLHTETMTTTMMTAHKQQHWMVTV